MDKSQRDNIQFPLRLLDQMAENSDIWHPRCSLLAIVLFL